MQALESLNDSQVNDFLSGKTPLNLSMRLGDHMMLIQLQLSTVNPTNSSASTSTGSPGSVNSSRTRSIFRSKTSSSTRSSTQQSSSTNSAPIRFTNANHMYKSLSSGQIPDKYRNRHETISPQPSTSRAADLIESKNEFEELRTIVSSLGKEKIENQTFGKIVNEINDVEMDTSLISTESDTLLEQSPIKSLSNLVSGPIKTSSLKSIPMSTPNTSTSTSTSSANSTTTTTNSTNNKLTSCPCKSVKSSNASASASGCDTNCQYSRNHHQLQHKRCLIQSELNTASRSSMLLHKTLNNAIAKTKSSGFQKIQTVRPADTSNLRRSKSSENITHAEQGIAKMFTAKSLSSHSELTVDEPMNVIDTTAGNSIETVNTPDTLAEASRNLTKTLRKLSKEVFSGKGDATAIAINDEKRARSSNSSAATNTNASGSHQTSTVAGLGSGAVIESMKNHGRGIYSGTFSGTLNPALQDRYGRPKRDISTVIHILNDLLSATPQYSRGARISFESTHNARKYVSYFQKKIFNYFV